MSDMQVTTDDVQNRVRPKQLAFQSALDGASTQSNAFNHSAEKQALHALGTPSLDFLPRVSEIFDLVAEANAGAAVDRPMATLKEALKEKVRGFCLCPTSKLFLTNAALHLFRS